VLDPEDQIMDKSRLGHGNMRVELYPEYPYINFYEPPDAYVVTWKPSLWYNDIDGMRLGVRFNSHYRQTRQLNLAGWYGANSSALDGRFNFSNRLGSRTNYQIGLMKLEGRIIGNLALTATWAKALGTPPAFNLAAGASYSELPSKDVDYAFRRVEVGDDVIDAPTWSAGKVNQAYVTFNVNPRGMKWRSLLNYEIRHANELGSDASFTRLQGNLNWILSQRGDGLYLRLFQGTFCALRMTSRFNIFSTPSTPARRNNSRAFICAAKARCRWKCTIIVPAAATARLLRSAGTFRKNLLAANLELRKAARLPLVGRLLAPVLGNSTLAFFDTGGLRFG
jgi:hypothetical protein